ncbi:YhcN/YlaJ family sporulation lipoprotein [Paenibacillus sp. HB172176]|uniref:YhcN/YlaJ family sporulation lipoprotein n=1 Tax=Paenibacillus sp. HB172176 TaxID=2493690 RepID=UPI00143C6B89|nr:YhcN/YlaJ family sporulation lipoprotein [Paenibacillus sp. HB172176]
MRQWILLAAAGLIAGSIAGGCAMNNDKDKVKHNSSLNQMADSSLHETNVNGVDRIESNNWRGSHKSATIKMSIDAGDAVAAIDAIKTAYVMLSDRNAYVAVSLEDTGLKPHSNGIARSDIGRMRGLSTGYNKLTTELRSQIEAKVKDAKPSVEHVYISASPEFVTRLHAYSTEMHRGADIQNYLAEFNAMAERLFPAVADGDEGKVRNDTNNIIQGNARRMGGRMLE